MRTIERTGQFKRDYKREAKGRHAKLLDQLLYGVLSSLATDQPLPAKNRDHALRAAIGPITVTATLSLI